MIPRYTGISQRRRCHHMALIFLAICLHTTFAQEKIKLMVGFNDVQEEETYIAQEAARVQTAFDNNDNSNAAANKIKYQFQNTNAIAMEATPEEYAQMQQDERFSYIEEDFEVKIPALTPEEHERRIQEVRSYAIAMVQADQNIPNPPPESENCVVYTCIVDSGVYVDHTDIPYARGDGYISGREFGSAVNNLWYRPINTNHGTNVAGIMFATPNNNLGMVGVVPDPPATSRICVKVAKVFPDGSDTTSISTVVQAVEWCASEANGAPMIINLSLATPSQTTTERRIYERLYDDGNVLLIAAAGNGGDDQFAYPASHDSVISVASVNSSKRRSSFSQFNSAVELSAPGSGIHVTGAAVNGLDVSSGTSYACPFVAAIAARVWAAGPRCRNSDIREALQKATLPLGNFVPNDEYGYGLVQALTTYNYLQDTIQCGVPTSQPSANPTNRPSVSPSLEPSGLPSAAPSSIPSAAPSLEPSSLPSALPSAAPSDFPSAIPSITPTDAPTIDCQRHLEPCTAESDCCKGFSCLRLSSDTEETWACRRETEQLFNTKPRLAALDGGRCRGGNAGNCPYKYNREDDDAWS